MDEWLEQIKGGGVEPEPPPQLGCTVGVMGVHTWVWMPYLSSGSHGWQCVSCKVMHTPSCYTITTKEDPR